MAKIFSGNGVNLSINTSLTRFFRLAGSGTSATQSQTEARNKIAYRSAGTMSGMFVRIAANTITATSTVVTHINGNNGNLTVSIGSSATGNFEDDGNSDSISAGDLVNAAITTGDTGTSITVVSIATHFTASSNTVKRWGAFNTSGNWSNLGLSYGSFGGNSIRESTESNVQMKVDAAGTWKNFFVYISTNTHDGTITFRSRINNDYGNLTTSAGASATGVFEDVGNSDTVAVDDLVNVSVDLTGSTGSITAGPDSMGVEWETTDGSFQLFSGSTEFVSISADLWFTPDGARISSGSSNTNVRQKIKLGGTISRLRAMLTFSGSADIYLQVNGTSTALAISGVGSGVYEDLSDEISVVSGDELNLFLDFISGSVRLRRTQMYFEQAAVTDITVNVNDTPSITESVTMMLVSRPNVNETPSLTEFVDLRLTSYVSVSETPSITESVTLSVGVQVNVFDNSSVTEVVSMEPRSYISVFDAGSVTESVVVEIITNLQLESSHVAWGLKVLDF